MKQKLKLHLEEESSVTEKSKSDQTNWNKVWLELHFQFTEVQPPWEFMQLLHLYFSTHDFTDQPDSHTQKWLYALNVCINFQMYNSGHWSASTDVDWMSSDLARAANFSLSSSNERMDSSTSLARPCNVVSSFISHGVSLGLGGKTVSFGLLSSFFFLYSETKKCWKILLTSIDQNSCKRGLNYLEFNPVIYIYMSLYEHKLRLLLWCFLTCLTGGNLWWSVLSAFIFGHWLSAKEK